MRPIGFCTWRYKNTQLMNERIELCFKLGATAIELSFASPKNLFDYELSEHIVELIKKFEYVSIHAPFHEIIYGNNEISYEVFKKLDYLCKYLPIKGIVIHPDIIDDFLKLNESKLPFLMENMDLKKLKGISAQDILEIKNKYDYGFVLDVQHAYEWDSKMNLSKSLINIMDDRLRQLHVSGQTINKHHTPTFSSDNKNEIIEIVKLTKAPIILEADLDETKIDILKNELEFIKNNV